MVQEDKNGSRGAEINELRKEINELLDEEETRWHQRSRVQWLQKGDRKKMRLEGYGIKMEDGVRIWGALQA